MRTKKLMFPMAADTVAKINKEELKLFINGQNRLATYFNRGDTGLALMGFLVIVFFDILLWNTPIFQREVFGKGPLDEVVTPGWHIFYICLLFVLPILCLTHIIYSLYIRAQVKKASCYVNNMELLQTRLNEITHQEELRQMNKQNAFNEAKEAIEKILQKYGSPCCVKDDLAHYLRM